MTATVALTDFPHSDVIERFAVVAGENSEYRYNLTRTWNRSLSTCVFVMLNPSTADGTDDDATIRKCMRFAHLWGYGGIAVVNLFAYRATKPAVLPPIIAQSLMTAVGPDNEAFIESVVRDAPGVICAWGAQDFARERARAVTLLLRRVCRSTVPQCLKLTARGAPWHPLYVPYSQPRLPF